MSEIFRAVHYQILKKVVALNESRLGVPTISKWQILIGVLHEHIRNICGFISPTSLVILVFMAVIISPPFRHSAVA